jgi:ABC-type multidrug transport system fused ATPase/permease subunit
MLKNISAVIKVVKFSWNYSIKIAGKKIWLLLFYTIYKNIHPTINAYFIKLIIDNLSQLGKVDSSVIIQNLILIFIRHFLLNSLNKFIVRHSSALSITLQRKLISSIEIDLAYKNASLPITTIEDSQFKDKYSLVKRESGMRLYPLVDSSINLIAGIITVIVTAIIMAKFDFIYLLILIPVQIPRILLIRPILNKLIYSASTSAKLSRYWYVYQSFLEGIRSSYETRILGIKEYVKDKLSKLQDETVGLFEKIENELLLPRVLISIIPMSGIFTVSFLAAKKVIAGILTIGDLQLIINTSDKLTNQLAGTIDDIGLLSETCVFVDQLIEVLNKEEVASSGEKVQFSEIESIEFENVSFKYPNANNYAVKNLSFKIDGSENIAIVGHNGAGKTTLVKLLCRFYQPTEGVIKINGIDIETFDIYSYWSLLSTLFQDFETFGMSATESIGYGNIEDIDNKEKIEKVAQITDIHNYLESLPLGYETPLIRDLENGVGLSTGQWQKIAISRALFRNSKIIILDEPTSNLDPESEEDIFNKLIETVESRIMILISHRFSTVKRADRILVIESGKLEEQGSHAELMKKGGLYAKLFHIQSESYKE